MDRQAAAKGKAEEKTMKTELAAKQREIRSKKSASNVATKKQRMAENSSETLSSSITDNSLTSASCTSRLTTLQVERRTF